MRYVLWGVFIYFFFPAILFVGGLAYVFVPKLLSHWQFYAIAMIPICWGIYLGLTEEPKK